MRNKVLDVLKTITISICILLTTTFCVGQTTHDQYQKLLCYIAKDTVVLNKLPLIIPDSLVSNWDKRFLVSKHLMPFSTVMFKNALKSELSDEKMQTYNNPLSLSEEMIMRPFDSCFSSTSNIKVFFSDIKDKYVIMDIGYDNSHYDTDAGRIAYSFSPFLSVLYELNGDLIINKQTLVLDN